MTPEASALTPYVAGALSLGGAGAFLSRRRELIARWCTWAVTAPVVGGALALGRPGAAGLAVAGGVVGGYEYARLARLSRRSRAVLYAAAVAAPGIALAAPSHAARPLVALPVVAAAVAALSSRDVSVAGHAARDVCFGAAWLAALAQLVVLGRHALPLFVAVSVADVAAWCGGKALRGPKLSRLSPRKRWAGVVAGAGAGLAVLALTSSLTIPLIVAVGVAAPAGDLLESALKRSARVKDAGSWLPGFGGLLDRIDALLVALAVAGALS
jgi:phosphatidate cytidylyltransferase